MTDQLPDIDLIIRQARQDRDAAIGAWLGQATHTASRWRGQGLHHILVLIASVTSLLSRTGRA
jgi:hypothetical protein